MANLVPETVGRGDVAGSTRFHGDGVAVVAAHGEDEIARGDGGGVDERIQPGAGPEDDSGLGIEGFHLHGKAHDEFLAVSGLHENGGAEGADDAVLLSGEAIRAGTGDPFGSSHFQTISPVFLLRA